MPSKGSKARVSSTFSTPSIDSQEEAPPCEGRAPRPYHSDVASSYPAMKQSLLHRQGPCDRYLTERDLHENHTAFGQKFRSNILTDLVSDFLKTFAMFAKSNCEPQHPVKMVKELLPITKTVTTYTWQAFFCDLVAGLSVGVAAIPMGMSYSMLAGLPPSHGLYANIFFPLFYMFFGTSTQVCMGTSALEATMVAEAVGKVVGVDAPYEVWLNACIGMAFFVGILLLLMRLLNLGVITSLLADSILSGFSSGVAVTIATTQLRDMFGLPTRPRLGTLQTWIFTARNIGQTNLLSLAIFMGGIVSLWIFQELNRRYFKVVPLPGSLIMLIAYLVIHYFVDYEKFGVRIVGSIPAGLPSLKTYDFNSQHSARLLLQALWYALVYFIIHISITKSLARINQNKVDANQEFLATGMASFLGSFFQCYPVATSVSRSSMAQAIGAQSLFYTIPNILVVIMTAAVITPLLYFLPIPALSSVIVFCAYGMFCLEEAIVLLRLWNPDLLLWLGTFLATVCFGSMEGVAVGVGLALAWLFKKNAFPRVVTLGRITGTYIYKDVDRFVNAKEIRGCKILRFDASLNFTNAVKFQTCVMDAAQIDQPNPTTNDPPISIVIVDASSINDMDVTSIRMLKATAQKFHQAQKLLLFSNWKGPMRDFLDRNAFYETVSLEHCFLSLHDAVLYAELYQERLNFATPPLTPHKSFSCDTTPKLSVKIEVESIKTKCREWNTFHVEDEHKP